MVRGKVQLRRIENPAHRQVSFCKRRAGLLKKATELSVLCDAAVGVIIFSPHGKLYELATKGTMERLTERYRITSGEAQSTAKNYEAEQEVSMLKKEINLLHQGLSHMFGGNNGTLTLDELLALEKNLEFWMYQIRSSKIMFQEIQTLKNKEGILQAANEVLQEKVLQSEYMPLNRFREPTDVVDQSGLLALCPEIVQQTELFDVAPLTADLQYPLTIENEYLDFGESIMRFSC